jgi:transcription-repair coupling factor (superfamily II helicase)
MYKRLAEVRTDEDVALLREEMLDRYGEPPVPVASLLEVARFRARMRGAGLTDVTVQGKYVRFAPVDLPDSATVRLNRLYPKSIVKANLRTMLVPRPSTAVVGGTPIRDEALLTWARQVVDTVVDPAGATPAPAAASQ